MSNSVGKLRLCWISLTLYFGRRGRSPVGNYDVALILTTALPGETERVVCEKLKAAIAKVDTEWLVRISTPTLNSERTRQQFLRVDADFSYESGNREVALSAVVISDDNVPGADVVHLTIQAEVKLFLPRDPVTGEFTDLQLQTRCLEALRVQLPTG